MYGTSSTKVTSDEQKGKCERIEESIHFTHVLKHINLIIDVPLQFVFYLHHSILFYLEIG